MASWFPIQVIKPFQSNNLDLFYLTKTHFLSQCLHLEHFTKHTAFLNFVDFSSLFPQIMESVKELWQSERKKQKPLIYSILKEKSHIFWLYMHPKNKLIQKKIWKFKKTGSYYTIINSNLIPWTFILRNYVNFHVCLSFYCHLPSMCPKISSISCSAIKKWH